MQLENIVSDKETPSFTEFKPVIPWQYKVLYDVDHSFNYDLGTHEMLFSGTMGSAKSLLAAHIVLKHVTEYEKARFLIGRTTMPDLKDTALDTILDHMEGDFIEGEDYEYNKTSSKISFYNGSEIVAKAWHNKKFKKFRSIKLSGAWIEETSENDETFFPAITEIFNRVGRLPNVKKNLVIYSTNPDSPLHPLYNRMMVKKLPTRHVYYSNAKDNPFLPPWYISNLLDNLDKKMAQRLVYGKWIEVSSEVIYYSYSRDYNFREKKYEFEFTLPVDISFDFNIAPGKPMSAMVGQYKNGIFHIAKTFIVDGARTADLMEEMDNCGLFNFPVLFRVYGDCTGGSNTPNSKLSNYEIIEDYLKRTRNNNDFYVEYEMNIHPTNPPIRKRHNIVNGMCKNANNKIGLYTYIGAEDADEGLRLTKLKKGSSYVEDDSYRLQHVTTAIGYWICKVLNDTGRMKTIYKKMM